ncbi:MAG: aminopeptidase P family protein [Actinomycetia bacterium]|nr:aminopeptidase P family protein [Actinomycetes bacterium]MCP4957680.1 aminopeptidase P family protein [Actinomycetes bacterium]
MPEKIARSLAVALAAHQASTASHRVGDGTPEFALAANEGHHLNIGPGELCLTEWAAAGLELPDLPAMRQYRLERTVAKLREFGYGGAVLFDPMNIRYVTDTTNMQLWVMHNGARYCYVSADGYVIVWDYAGCEFFSGHSHVVDEVRPATGSTYFLAGPRYAEIARRWADEIVSVVGEHQRGNRRLAVDQCHQLGYEALAAAGIEVGYGVEVMELARVIKSVDEIKAMRCATHACEATMGEMRAALTPGMTEREVWAMLHEGNIRRAGEWIETQILSSGPRTNPWMQEASARVIEEGDMVAYDTDLVGAYGMMCDISRSFIAGGTKPTKHQANLHSMALDVLAHNTELLTPGRTLRELTFDALLPDVDRYRHYSCQFHGVGQCDEYPEVYVPRAWDDWGYDAVLEPGMVLTVESFIGDRRGGEGVKFENQVLVTEDGPELMTPSTLEL